MQHSSAKKDLYALYKLFDKSELYWYNLLSDDEQCIVRQNTNSIISNFNQK